MYTSVCVYIYIIWKNDKIITYYFIYVDKNECIGVEGSSWNKENIAISETSNTMHEIIQPGKKIVNTLYKTQSIN